MMHVTSLVEKSINPYSKYKITLRAKTKIGFRTDVSEASPRTDEVYTNIYIYIWL